MKRFQRVSDPALVVDREELLNMKCLCGSKMIISETKNMYLPERGAIRTRITLRCSSCLQLWRFVEVLKFDYCKVPISIAAAALLRDLKGWCEKICPTTSDAVIIIGALVWIVLTIYMITLGIKI
jgi:hypothetical protein